MRKYLLIRYSLLLITGLLLYQIAICQQASEIHNAVSSGDLKKVSELIETNPKLLELKDNNGNTPLNIACGGFRKQLEIARYLINKGADINTKNYNGSTPLHNACSISNPEEVELVKLLILKGADVNARQNYGATPLRYATTSFDAASFLIEHGADINATTDGNSILHYALTYNNNDDLSKLLIEKGAKINHKDYFGNTELHIAAMRGFTEVIDILVKYGANIEALNNNNHTALYYASKHGYRSAAEKLISLGADKKSIGEINYGKATYLSSSLKKGEAYLWYMKAGGYAVKTKNYLFILSQQLNYNSTPEAGLANGHVNPQELSDQKIYVLTSYPWSDFINSDGDRFQKQIPETKWIFFSGKPTEVNKNIQGLPPHYLIGPDSNVNIDEINLFSTPRIPGVGFLFEVDGLKIFDCKSFACNDDSSRIEKYKKAINSLKSLGSIDIVILPVNGHVSVKYEPYLYLIDQLSPKAIYLTGGEGEPGEYSKCADFLKIRLNNVNYPESRIEGDRFHFAGKSINK